MTRIPLVEFRKNADKVLKRVQRGERLVLTRRGLPVVRLEPILTHSPGADDPIYRLHELAVDRGRSLKNRDIDRTVYGL